MSLYFVRKPGDRWPGVELTPLGLLSIGDGDDGWRSRRLSKRDAAALAKALLRYAEGK